MILPDEWVAPGGISFTASVADGFNQQFNTAEWAKLEESGAVFLPVSGYGYGKCVYNLDQGYYWTATAGAPFFGYDTSWNLYFGLNTNKYEAKTTSNLRLYKSSVRLAREVK